MKKLILFSMLCAWATLLGSQPRIWYVSSTGNMFHGDSWNLPCTFEYALLNAQYGDQIWVKQGNYTIAPQIINTSIEIYGGFSGSENDVNERFQSGLLYSTIEMDENYFGTNPLIWVNTDPYQLGQCDSSLSYFTLDGFILSDAETDFQNNWGGALRADSIKNLTLKNLTVCYCIAFDGGGMYLNNILHGWMENVLFFGNFATSFGGGLFLSYCTDFTMVNTAFTTNNIANLQGDPNYGVTTFNSGGFFMEASNVIVQNLTATNNSDGNAGCIANSTVKFYNSIIYPDSINIEYNHADTVWYTNCCLWTTSHLRLQGMGRIPYLGDWGNIINDWDIHNTVITSNIFSANPLIDLYTIYLYPSLQSNSPCIDAGNAAYYTGFPQDLHHSNRVDGSEIDLGAMEYHGN